MLTATTSPNAPATALGGSAASVAGEALGWSPIAERQQFFNRALLTHEQDGDPEPPEGGHRVRQKAAKARPVWEADGNQICWVSAEVPHPMEDRLTEPMGRLVGRVCALDLPGSGGIGVALGGPTLHLQAEGSAGFAWSNIVALLLGRCVSGRLNGPGVLPEPLNQDGLDAPLPEPIGPTLGKGLGARGLPVDDAEATSHLHRTEAGAADRSAVLRCHANSVKPGRGAWAAELRGTAVSGRDETRHPRRR